MKRLACAIAIGVLAATPAAAEDSYDLWLRYLRIDDPARLQQYRSAITSISRLDRVPEAYLLWFHHVPWDHRMPSGRTLWDELTVLAIQEEEARWWRDASVLYFQTFSKRPIRDDCGSPPHTLEHYMSITHRYAPN